MVSYSLCGSYFGKKKLIDFIDELGLQQETYLPLVHLVLAL